MADIALVQIVKQGRDAVAAWREEHSNQTMDLNACYMSHAASPWSICGARTCGAATSWVR